MFIGFYLSGWTLIIVLGVIFISGAVLGKIVSDRIWRKSIIENPTKVIEESKKWYLSKSLKDKQEAEDELKKAKEIIDRMN